ncbi:MAG: nitrilase family protein [Oleiphilaceae bacterium]|nr:nitrilase family protein [Oleiphilaceae bacterium]
MNQQTYSPKDGVSPDLIVASVQMEPQVGQKADNISRSRALIEKAAAGGASIVVLPELTTSGYVFGSREEAFTLAEQIPEGDSTKVWSELAERLNIYIIAGIAERDGNRLYNSAVFLGPQGYLGVYRKLHLWNNEHLFFESGNLGLPVFDTEIGRLAAVICYDGWFPEVYRLLAMKGADIIGMPTNWVPMAGAQEGALAMANTLALANAHINGVNIVCANRIGTERDQLFIGRSLIVNARGECLAGPASPDQEEILYASINLKETRQAQHVNLFNSKLRDRRSDIYDPMLGTGWLPLPRH